jgi:transcriptional regulator with XRE-family HTH domain
MNGRGTGLRGTSMERLSTRGGRLAELARQSDLSRSDILSYMREVSLPPSEDLAKLAKALDMTPEELLPRATPKRG